MAATKKYILRWFMGYSSFWKTKKLGMNDQLCKRIPLGVAHYYRQVVIQYRPTLLAALMFHELNVSSTHPISHP